MLQNLEQHMNSMSESLNNEWEFLKYRDESNNMKRQYLPKRVVFLVSKWRERRMPQWCLQATKQEERA